MSNFLTLNFADLGKGIIVAILTSILTTVKVILDAGTMPDLVTLGHIAVVGLIAGLAYLCKNLLTNSSGQIATPEQK